MHPTNLLTEWASVLLSGFADAGVRDVVISPGSRSMPFVVAAIREKRLLCHSIIDERAAAFFALGQARVTGLPSLLLCTSGSAGTHYFPAIIEAREAYIPLLVLTADRPTELQDCSAPQTIDQIKLFGDHVRKFFELGQPDPSDGSIRALRRIAAQAAFRASWPTPGAVHLNARARKPLEPVLPTSEDDANFAARVHAIRSAPATVGAAPATSADPASLQVLAEWLRASGRGLISCGPWPAWRSGDADAIFELAAVTGFPIAPDVSSQLRFRHPPPGVTVLDAIDTLLRSKAFRERGGVDMFIQIGPPPVNGGWTPPRDDGSTKRVVLTDHGWADPESNVSMIVFGEPSATARQLTAAIGQDAHAKERERAAWRAFAGDANARTWQVIDAELESTGETLTEAHTARGVVAALPPDSTLVVGNSLAVRVVGMFCRQGAARATVLSQRGASGIDGLIAGAVGAGSRSANPVTLLIGDVSFLHDVSSLAFATKTQVPLVIVVLQNRGGRIFEQLPIASINDLEREILEMATTPHQHDVLRLAAAYGVRCERAEHPKALDDALRRAYSNAGCTVVEAITPTSGSAAAQLHRIGAAVDAALFRME